MASVRSTIELIITGATRGLNAASAEAQRMARRVAEAERQVSEARRRSAEAESRVADVESRLAGARAQHTAALSQIGVAETNLARTRADANEGTTRLAAAEERLEALRQGGASAQTIARAEADINRVRQESDLAARRTQAAEAALERARGNAAARAGQIAALEERLQQARGRAFSESERLARAETRLATLRNRGTTDLNRQRDGLLGVFDAFGRLAQAFSGADGASTSLLSKLGALHSVITSIGGPIVQAVVGILEFVAVMGAAGEIIGVVGGLIGQVLAGAPAILLALGAAAGTVALGMDGIKKAAQAAAPAFEKLKASVSGVFERELTPFFARIGQVLPQLTAGFERVAVAVSQVAKEVIATTTSARGLTVINSILNGTAAAFQAMAPGIATFVKGLLDAANIGGPAFQRLGAALGTVLDQLGGVFSRLADNGTIRAAVDGLSSVIIGLGNVLGPVIEALIRMGAALGPTLGGALTELGNIIQTSIPFFEHLAQVAGDLLISAFQQLGPAIRDVIVQLLPGANQGLDGFANVIKNVVLPAIADFIRNIPAMIESIKQFFLAATANALSFASTFLGAISSILGVLHDFFSVMALIPGPMQKSFAEAAAATEGFKGKVDELKTGVDGLKDKTVKLQLQTQGAELIKGVQDTINKITGKTVQVISQVFGTKENQALKEATDNVPSKAVTTTSTVVGEQANKNLTAAISAVLSKTTTTLSNVFGEPQNRSLTGAIKEVNSKTVDVRANVFGEAAVRSLVGAINSVHDASATVTTYLRTVTQTIAGRASGGPVLPNATYLVGEQGPELLTLGGRGGFISTAAETRRMLNSRGASGSSRSPVGAGDGGEAPVTVNIAISQEAIAGIAEATIVRRDRATKRTVLAGSGVTF